MNKIILMASIAISILATSCSSTHILSKYKYRDNTEKLVCIKSKHTGEDFDKNFGKIFKKFNETTFNDKESCKKSDDFLASEKQYKDSMLYYIVSTPKSYQLASCKMKSEILKNKYQKLGQDSFEKYSECSKSKQLSLANDKAKKKAKSRRAWASKKAEQNRVKNIKAYISNNPKYKEYETTAITKKVSMGMPEQLLILSWGSPKDISKTVGSWGVNKQFVYGLSNYVYTKNGVVTSWQN